MTQPPNPAGPPAPTTPGVSPEVAANQRIHELQSKVMALQQEVQMLEGKLLNRDPRLVESLRKENAELSQRFNLLKKAIFAIISESYQPRTADEAKLQYDVLRKATIEYCVKTKIDPEIWKSIAS